MRKLKYIAGLGLLAFGLYTTYGAIEAMWGEPVSDFVGGILTIVGGALWMREADRGEA